MGKSVVVGLGFLILACYAGGFLEQLFTESAVRLNPIRNLWHGISRVSGLKCTAAVIVLFGVIAVLIMLRSSGKETYDERNFEISRQGTYGTAGFMNGEEQEKVLQTNRQAGDVKGVIFGRDLKDGQILSLPVDSRLNRNFAVCGSRAA